MIEIFIYPNLLTKVLFGILSLVQYDLILQINEVMFDKKKLYETILGKINKVGSYVKKKWVNYVS